MSFKEKIKNLVTRTLRVDILTTFLLLIVISTISIISFTYTKDSKMIIDFSKKYMKKVSTLAIHETMHLFQDAQESSQLGAQLINFQSDLSISNTDLLDYMFATLKYNLYFDNYYIGTVNGSFLMVTRLPLEEEAFKALPEKPPARSFFRVRLIDRSKKTATDKWVYYDSSGQEIETRDFTNPEYDPRSRGWFKGIQSQKEKWSTEYSIGSEEFIYSKRQAFWTNVYPFSLLMKPGITVSDPAFSPDGKLIGVFGTDLTLETLSEFLESEKIGRDSMEIILNHKGDIIAGSDLLIEKLWKSVKERPSVFNIENRIFQAAYDLHMNDKKDDYIFTFNNEKYLSTFNHFPVDFQKNWVVLIIAPLSDFIGEIVKNHTIVLFISLGIMGVAIAIEIFLAHRIAKPIMDLAKEIDEIRNFNLDRKIDVHSNIKEIKRISDATIAMQAAIKSFSYFVPQELVEKLIKHGKDLKLGGEHKKVTIFFSDIQDFTAITEGFEPEELMVYLSDYLDAVSKTILSLHGTIDKYIGDMVMAFWGAPDDDPEGADHGCRAALISLCRIRELNEKWKSKSKTFFHTRIGLHKADVIAGIIGTSERRNYTIIGDGVNLASRLESLNRVYGTSILLSEDLYQEVKDHFLTRPLDIVAVRGKKEATKIYELVGQYNAEPEITPSVEDIHFCEEFRKGFELYFSRKFHEAEPIFIKLSQLRENDRPTKIYLEMSEKYNKMPPPDDWDGIRRMGIK